MGIQQSSRRLRVLPSTPSGKQTSNALIYTGPSLLNGVKIVTDGANDVAVVVFDGTDGSGTQVDEWIVTGSENYGGTQYGISPLIMETGIYITVSGTGGYYYLSYFVPKGDTIEEWKI